MSEITEHTPLEVLLNDSVMKHFNWAFVEGCNTELAQLRATLAEQDKRIAALTAENLQFSAGDYLLDEIGAALNCAPDVTILQRIAELGAALTSIASTTGRNGRTASNIVKYANEVLKRHPAPAPSEQDAA